MAGRRNSVNPRRKCRKKLNRYDPARPDYRAVHGARWGLIPTPARKVSA